MSKIINLKEVFVIIAYFIFMYLLYLKLGIIEINEAEKYIQASRSIIDGEITKTLKQHFFYSSYILFLTLIFLIGSIKIAVFAQLLLNILAAICLKKSINLLLGNKFGGQLGQICFLFCIPIQTWALTLFSDNFFVCMICITLYYTLKHKTKTELSIWLALCLLLIFSRPPGIFFTYCFIFYYLYQLKFLKPPFFYSLAILALAVIFFLLFTTEVETKGYIKPIAAGAVIVDKPDYDIPEFNERKKETTLHAYIYLYNKHGFSYLTTLYYKKVKSFFTLTRSYYSTAHNYILIAHYILYPLAIAGFIFLYRNTQKSTAMLFLLLIFFAANLTGLTYNEWHYRFTLSIFPALIILSVIGINFLFNSKKAETKITATGK